MAIANTKGFKFVYMSQQVIPSDTAVTESGATEEEKLLHKRNSNAIDLLIMSTSGISYGLVEKANGDAFVALKNLDAKWEPKQAEDLTELQKEFTGCVLDGTKEDPDLWWDRIYQFQQKFTSIGEKYTKEEFELKAHVLGNLPKEYISVITVLSISGAQVSYDDVCREVTKHWQQNFKSSAGKKDAHALNTEYKKKFTPKNKFKGTCTKCGKYGHKGADCWADKSGAKSGSDGGSGRPEGRKCYKCQKFGHIAKDCTTKKEEEQVHFVGSLDFISSAASIPTLEGKGRSMPMKKRVSVHAAACRRLCRKTITVMTVTVRKRVLTKKSRCTIGVLITTQKRKRMKSGYMKCLVTDTHPCSQQRNKNTTTKMTTKKLGRW